MALRWQDRNQLLIFVLAGLAWTACGLSPGDARKELTAIGVQFTPQAFVSSAGNNDLLAVELFIVAGMDLNVTAQRSIFGEGATALAVAAEEGHEDVVKLLIEAGAADVDGSTLAKYAHSGDSEVVRMLLTAGANDDAHMTVAAVAAAGYGHTEVVRMLLDAGAETPWALAAAVAGGHEDAVKLLIFALGREVGAADIDGATLTRTLTGITLPRSRRAKQRKRGCALVKLANL